MFVSSTEHCQYIHSKISSHTNLAVACAVTQRSASCIENAFQHEPFILCSVPGALDLYPSLILPMVMSLLHIRKCTQNQKTLTHILLQSCPLPWTFSLQRLLCWLPKLSDLDVQFLLKLWECWKSQPACPTVHLAPSGTTTWTRVEHHRVYSFSVDSIVLRTGILENPGLKQWWENSFKKYPQELYTSLAHLSHSFPALARPCHFADTFLGF